MNFYRLFFLGALSVVTSTTVAQHKFQHPGITHTQADIDRMKAMIAAKREPFFSAYETFRQDATSSYNYQIRNVKPTSVAQDQMDNLLVSDGHAAHNIALMWHFTGDERYARKAVEILNNFSGIRSVSNRGTMALNASKVHLLIEAAELMRDYDGWSKADQDAFKAMLVYPGYSTTTDMNKLYASLDESRNGITWYWNAYQFDWGRHGNQETLPMRMLMGLGIYLDNDTIYERARRYYLGLSHPEGDLPYVSGPPHGMNPTPTTTSDYFDYYATPNRTFGNTADYGYNGQLLNYVWQNGQQQESSRDQGHAEGGLGSLAHIADIAWNQGNDLYSAYDYRLLLGFEWYHRYNLSYIQAYDDQPTAWEPTGYTANAKDATFDNGKFIRQRDRTQQWYSKRPNPTNENVDPNTVLRGNSNKKFSAWIMPYMHYAVRMGIDETQADHSDMGANPSMLWLARGYKKGYELAGGYEGNGWTTDWVGWSNLTKTRTRWMAGDPCTFNDDGTYRLGIHTADSPFRAVDYDYFNGETSGQWHTYYDTTTGNSGQALRHDDVDIMQDGTDYVVCNVAEGEWLSYTLSVPQSGAYNVYVTYQASANSRMGAAADDNTYSEGLLPATTGYEEHLLTSTLTVDAGAVVLRLKATGSVAADLRLRSVRIERSQAYSFVPAEWVRTNATSTATFENVSHSVIVTAGNLTAGAHAQWNLSDVNYQFPSSRHLFIVKGQNIRPNTLRLMSMNGLTPAHISRHYSVTATDGDSIFVWNLTADATLSSVVADDPFTVTALSFYAANASGQQTFCINDVNFLSEEELNSQTAGVFLPVFQGSTDAVLSNLYMIDGRQVSGDHLVKGIYICSGRKVVVR